MNDKAKLGWDTALNILKPDAKTLQRGLALHRESLVVDAYGLAPNCRVPREPLIRAYEEGASFEELQMLEENYGMTNCVTDVERDALHEIWDAAGVTCVLRNAGREGNSIPRLLTRLSGWMYVTDRVPEVLFKAVCPDDIERARREDKHCLYLSTNGVPLPMQCDNVQEELLYIRIFFQLGVRMMHLTYNRRNPIGDGCGEKSDAGLSDFGVAAVKEMNRAGVIVDVAHSGWRTSLEAARASSRPVVASHTVCAALNPHYRGKPDEVIKAIVDTGGYIGITCVPEFLGGTGDIRALMDHIDYVKTRFGVDHAAIGTDVGCSVIGNEVPAPWPWSSQKKRAVWESLWPPAQTSVRKETPEQIRSMEWTNWPLFTVGLVQRGYSDEDIRKIIGGNVLRVAREVWKAVDEG